ncbi:porin PorA family protein [Rhodococcoides yunnanense]|uniref:porin PorA family protein n=1 Tax=Rhodococcoides yunnanense TaxID=278209 RepID=UPI001114F783|nr:porin PorA family protein [Rhodococcus yunnanensis]
MKAGKLTGSIFFILGLLLVAVAAILRFSVAPGLTELSDRFNREIILVGTLSIPNPDPAAGGAMITLPVEAATTSSVRSLSDDSGVVSFDTQTYLTPRAVDSQPISNTSFTYAVNRSTFEQTDPPAGMSVIDQKGGVTVNFPPNSNHENLTTYNAVVQEAQPLEYQGTKSKSGRTLDIYTTDASGPVRNPDVLHVLQENLGPRFGTDGTTAPKLALLALGIPAVLLDSAPEQVPVSFSQADKTEIWVDPTLGSIVNQIGTTTVTTVFELPGQDIPVPASITKLEMDRSVVSSSISDLDESDSQLPLVTTWIPVALLVLGIVFAILAVRLLTRPTRPTSAT